MTGAAVTKIVLDALEFAVNAGGRIVEVVTGRKAEDLKERIAKARETIADPIDTSEDDAARWERLERALAGDGEPQPPAQPYPDAGEGS